MSVEKTGSQTSEFKLTAGGIVGSFLAAVAAALTGYPRVALALAGVGAFLAAAYTFGRTWLKKERAGAVDWLSPEQEATLEKAMHAVGTLSDVLKLVIEDQAGEQTDQAGEKPDGGD